MKKTDFLKDLGLYVKIGRSRSIGSSNLPNALSCVFDFSVPQNAPLTNQEFNLSAAPFNITCVPADSTNGSDDPDKGDSDS